MRARRRVGCKLGHSNPQHPIISNGCAKELAPAWAPAPAATSEPRLAKAPADGYTLLQIVTPHAINAALYSNLNFDFMRDIAPVICAARRAYVVVVHPSVPARTIPEFIAYAKANPGKINYGSAGPGTPQNIACELFKMMAGVDLVHVPYRGGAPAATDLVGGQIQVIFAPVSESIQHIQAGKLRALAVTTAARLDVLPDVPTVAEFVPGYEASGFAGIGEVLEMSSGQSSRPIAGGERGETGS